MTDTTQKAAIAIREAAERGATFVEQAEAAMRVTSDVAEYHLFQFLRALDAPVGAMMEVRFEAMRTGDDGAEFFDIVARTKAAN